MKACGCLGRIKGTVLTCDLHSCYFANGFHIIKWFHYIKLFIKNVDARVKMNEQRNGQSSFARELNL
jgi:hypothetical protein